MLATCKIISARARELLVATIVLYPFSFKNVNNSMIPVLSGTFCCSRLSKDT